MKRMLNGFTACSILLAALTARFGRRRPNRLGSAAEVQGRYFAKKAYIPKAKPIFAATRALLPAPRFDDHPGYVDMYWKAWELAFRNFHEPAAGTGFVSAFIDAAFNQNIFAWDTCFMTLFTNTAHPLVPGIASLDNFYTRQHEDGEICREIDRSTGRDYEAWINPGKPLYQHLGIQYRRSSAARHDPIRRARSAPRPVKGDARRARPPALRLGRNGKLPDDGRQGPLAPGLRAAGQVLPFPARVPSPGKRPVHDGLGQHGQFAAQPLPQPGRRGHRHLLRDGPRSPARWRRWPGRSVKRKRDEGFDREADATGAG